MPYTPTTWTSGSTALSQANMSNLETQYTEATNSFEQDLFSAFVFSGFLATKDGSTANKLDVTAGVAFLLQSDNTLRRRSVSSSSQTTSTHSTTYHLYLQPAGTWYWSTSNSPASNSLFIAQVTTDSSGNISTVTNEATINTAFLASMVGQLTLPYLKGVTVSPQNPPVDDALFVYDHTGTLGVTMGWANGDGLFAYDQVNDGFVFSAGTASGIDFAGALSEANGRVAVEGSHSSGQPALSYGSGVPAALATNEIYFQTS